MLQLIETNWPAVVGGSAILLGFILIMTYAVSSLRKPRRKRAKFRHIKTGPGSGL